MGCLRRTALQTARRQRRTPHVDHPDQERARMLGSHLHSHDVRIPQYVDRPTLLGNARRARGRPNLPHSGDAGRAGGDQHLDQPASLPRGGRRDRGRPHRRLRLLAAQCRARAVERGARLRQARARPQAAVTADPAVGGGQRPLVQVTPRRHHVLALAGTSRRAGGRSAIAARIGHHQFLARPPAGAGQRRAASRQQRRRPGRGASKSGSTSRRSSARPRSTSARSWQTATSA